MGMTPTAQNTAFNIIKADGVFRRSPKEIRGNKRPLS